MMNWKRKTIKLRLAFALFVAAVLAATAAESAIVQPVFHPSFQAASDAAAADQSLVLLIFSAEWCGPCKLLKNKTLSSPEFLRQENPLHITDVDIDADQKMAREFAIEAVPTLVLLTADGKIISRQTGFMEVADLLAWLKAGRDRAAAGQWEGTAPGAQFGELVKKAEADHLGTNEIQQLVDLLGDANPANREQAGKILLAQRENAVPALIEAVGNSYLGKRIAASELLQRLAPGVTPVDPWQSPQETSNALVSLRKWWANTGKLPPVPSTPATNSYSANAVTEALEQLRGDNPLRRTAAMTALVRFGAEALPAVREAIKRAENNGDQRALGFLEDVQWTILVPDVVEQQSGGIRSVLARGKSSERQAATEKLGHIGHDALGVVVELANDPDPLVVESAIHALSSISGGDTIPMLTTLLKSQDSNLRMTAAQALGHTKNAAAVTPLLIAIHDSDEVVACTALSALEETQASDSYRSRQREVSGEITNGLKSCLADSRWRVRAAAAEVIGKLSIGKLAGDLRKLLDDSDGFVVKSALTALSQLNATPESKQLIALGKHQPSLQGDAVEMLLHSESEETVKTVTELFDSGTADTQVAILSAFLRRGISENPQTDEGWKPMLSQAIASPDPRLRRAAAEVLGRRSPKLATPLIGQLLADTDRETRMAAADVVLRILDQGNGGSTEAQVSFSSFATPKTNKPVATAAQLKTWHGALLQRAEPAPELNLAAAIFATGDGKTDLTMLLSALTNSNSGSDSNDLNQKNAELAIGAFMPKLILPEGRPVLEKLSMSPVWFALALSQNARCQPEVADYLLDPPRFKSVVEPAAGPALFKTLELLAGYDYENGERRKWTLWSETDRTKAMAAALIDSTNAAWRAAAVFSLGLRADAKDNSTVFTNAIADSNPWVRASAVRVLARITRDRPALEKSLAPMLADTNRPVASAAAMALLEPETRQAAGMEELNYFEFETVRGGRSQSINQNGERPLTTLDGKPPFLDAARKWLNDTNDSEFAVFALLLAQYGEFDGIDRLVTKQATLDSDKDQSGADVLLTGIALSRDIKYLATLKQMASVRHDDWELRKILQALKGMSGPDARQLRLDINKKIRNAGNSSGAPDIF